MFSWLKTKRRVRALSVNAIPDEQWNAALCELPFLDHYAPLLLARLREITTLFLVEKSIVSGATTGEHIIEVTPHMRIVIAVQACVLILGRGESVSDAMNDYDGWDNVVVYPGDFPQTYDFEDEAGVVHRTDEPVAGESWEGGPVLLSWPAVEAGYDETGMALVIHEFAHKIDMLNGEIDGVPPLPPAQHAVFKTVVNRAYNDFVIRVDANEDTAIDPYAAEHIEEFFAVSCEVFFAEPELLQIEYPDYFEQLCSYFRIDPIAGVAV
jgi:MtfA peptidase